MADEFPAGSETDPPDYYLTRQVQQQPEEPQPDTEQQKPQSAQETPHSEPKPRKERSQEATRPPQEQPRPCQTQQPRPLPRQHAAASNGPSTPSPETRWQLRTLSEAAFTSLLYNFDDIYSTSEDFIRMDIDEVCDLLGSDQLNVADEKAVFYAVCRWIDHAPKKRRVHVARLLRTIRLGLLTTEFFVQTVLPHTYVRQDKAAREIARETLRFLNDSDLHPTEEVDFDNPIARPRVPRDVLFVIGGWSGNCPTDAVEVYDTRADTWTVCSTTDSIPRAYHATVALGTNIYVIGGFDGKKCLSSCRMFDPIQRVWNKAARMHHKRCYVSVAVLQGYLYAMGGYDGEVWKKSVEKYDPREKRWYKTRPMNHARSDAGATTLDSRIYICGGFDGSHCLDTVEVYNPISKQWTFITPMPKRRSGVGVMAYHGCIYVLGGFNGNTRKSTGKRYDPKTKEWSRVPEMYTPRSNFATAVIDDQLFAIGGYSWDGPIPSVECYDIQSDEWLDATDMSINRSALSACVVTGLPNVQDYIYRRPPLESVTPASPGVPSTSGATAAGQDPTQSSYEATVSNPEKDKN